MSKNVNIDKKKIIYENDNSNSIATDYFSEKPFTLKIKYVKGHESRYQVWEDENTVVCYDPEPDIICISTPFLID